MIFHGRKKELWRISNSACQRALLGVITRVSDVSDESEGENSFGGRKFWSHSCFSGLFAMFVNSSAVLRDVSYFPMEEYWVGGGNVFLQFSSESFPFFFPFAVDILQSSSTVMNLYSKNISAPSHLSTSRGVAATVFCFFFFWVTLPHHPHRFLPKKISPVSTGREQRAQHQLSGSKSSSNTQFLCWSR